jgi:hypothetical protein
MNDLFNTAAVLPGRRLSIARPLAADDDVPFRALLREVYGETYAHSSMYHAGSVGAMLAQGHALWGEFAEDGSLIAHTAFLAKDPIGDYVESGLSFASRALAARRMRAAHDEPRVWAELLAGLASPYMHQHTTTWHKLAQRYAHQHLHAKFAGFVFDYTIGEQLTGIKAHDSMHAVTLTTELGPRERSPAGDVRLWLPPTDTFADWLSALAESFGILISSNLNTVAVASSSLPCLSNFEYHADQGLARAVVLVQASAEAIKLATLRHASRVALVHLPIDARIVHYGALRAAGYVPVGIRAHATRPSEIVLQYMTTADTRRIVRAYQCGEICLFAAYAQPARSYFELLSRST